MLAWLLFFILLIVEIAGLVWWLRHEYLPVFWSGNAATVYAAVLAADCIITWLTSFLLTPGGTFGTALLAFLGVILFVVVWLGTLFFRWVVRTDMNDIK